jgi:hypothetical protein
VAQAVPASLLRHRRRRRRLCALRCGGREHSSPSARARTPMGHGLPAGRQRRRRQRGRWQAPAPGWRCRRPQPPPPPLRRRSQSHCQLRRPPPPCSAPACPASLPAAARTPQLVPRTARRPLLAVARKKPAPPSAARAVMVADHPRPGAACPGISILNISDKNRCDIGKSPSKWTASQDRNARRTPAALGSWRPAPRRRSRPPVPGAPSPAHAAPSPPRGRRPRRTTPATNGHAIEAPCMSTIAGSPWYMASTSPQSDGRLTHRQALHTPVKNLPGGLVQGGVVSGTLLGRGSARRQHSYRAVAQRQSGRAHSDTGTATPPPPPPPPPQISGGYD